MNVATTPQLSPAQQRLQALVGMWRSGEKVGAPQWTAAGPAISEIVTEPEFSGLFVIQRYAKARDGKTSFESRNIFGVDQSDGSTKLGQFDSLVFLPRTPASGAGDGETLERNSPRGAVGTRYTLESPDWYPMTVAFRPAGSDGWQDVSREATGA
jgi:hypothetical protein